MDLRWEPLDHTTFTILVLRVRWTEVARVQEHVSGERWVTTVACQRRDWRRRLTTYAPNQGAAMRWARRWTLAHLESVLADLPWHENGRIVWPACNPPPPEFR
jgi:hypothetical protein